MAYENVMLGGEPAPVRNYVYDLMDDVLQGTLNPSPVFTKTVSLDDVAEAYRARNKRDAIR